MEVTFFRHGIAVDRADPLVPVDVERPLTLDGKNKTEAAARGLRALAVRPALVLSSPYRRCVQSARLVAQALGLSRKSVLEIDALSPGSDPQTLWAELAVLGRESLLCVGHGGSIEPMSGFALGLLASAAPPTDMAGSPTEGVPDALPDEPVFRTLHIKKAGALQLDVRLEPVLSARLSWLLSPRILRQLGRS